MLPRGWNFGGIIQLGPWKRRTNFGRFASDGQENVINPDWIKTGNSINFSFSLSVTSRCKSPLNNNCVKNDQEYLILFAEQSCRALATLFTHAVEQLRVTGDNKVCGQRNVLDILMIYILFQGVHTAFQKLKKKEHQYALCFSTTNGGRRSLVSAYHANCVRSFRRTLK